MRFAQVMVRAIARQATGKPPIRQAEGAELTQPSAGLQVDLDGLCQVASARRQSEQDAIVRGSRQFI